MILKNELDKNREVSLLYGVKIKNKKYVIYKDNVSCNIYAGRKENNELLPVNEEELKELNKELDL